MVRYTNPDMFYLFIPLIIVLIWYVYKGEKINSNLNRVGDSLISKFLLNRFKYKRIRLRSILIVLGTIFILFASTGPQIGTKLTELNRMGVDIFILMDTSISMNAEDPTSFSEK